MIMHILSVEFSEPHSFIPRFCLIRLLSRDTSHPRADAIVYSPRRGGARCFLFNSHLASIEQQYSESQGCWTTLHSPASLRTKHFLADYKRTLAEYLAEVPPINMARVMVPVCLN
jgi:hypothetical protein